MTAGSPIVLPPSSICMSQCLSALASASLTGLHRLGIFGQFEFRAIGKLHFVASTFAGNLNYGLSFEICIHIFGYG